MILIGENIHVISKRIREALINRDESFIIELIKLQNNMDFIDLNVGPAKNNLEGILLWLANIVMKETNAGISFDTTNVVEMKTGLEVFKGKSFINSISLDTERIEKMTDMAVQYQNNLIALTLSKETGIPKTSDGRLEIAFEIYEKCMNKGIDNEKIYFDPLILPVCIDQSQGIEALNTIKMIKESFDPPVKTVIGLSNISNGCPGKTRPLINRVFGCMAFGAGLDAAIIDASDTALVEMFKMLENNAPKSKVDELYIRLAAMIRDFDTIESIDYNVNSEEESSIMKAANILLNNEVYSHSFTQI